MHARTTDWSVRWQRNENGGVVGDSSKCCIAHRPSIDVARKPVWRAAIGCEAARDTAARRARAHVATLSGKQTTERSWCAIVD